jgi:hypothetical protein
LFEKSEKEVMKMETTMTIDDFMNYAQNTPMQYKIPEKQDFGGYIPFERRGWINPMKTEPEQVITYVHEILHHHYEGIGEDITEEEVERQAQDFYAAHRLLCHKMKHYMMDDNPLERIVQEIDEGWD